MLPVIALVGRPNVGKSTIFNRLTSTRDALVADIPGLTRDRQYGRGHGYNKSFLVIDTGGLEGVDQTINKAMLTQTQAAIQEADYCFFIVDAQIGLTGGDQEIASMLRHAHKNVTLVINKTDDLKTASRATEFFELGFERYCYISAAHNQGLYELISTTLTEIPEVEASDQTAAIKVALVGRPNVGKSTLINRLLGEERVVVFDQPGTTRDSICIPFRKDEQDYILIDTAGVRRRGRIIDIIEKFSVIKTLQAVQEAHVVIMLLNAKEGISDQDLRILGHILKAGRSLIIAINQWDGLTPEQRQNMKVELDRRLSFVTYAKHFFISALHGTGVGLLLNSVKKVYRSATQTLTSSYVTKLMETAVEQFPPPVAKGRRIKLRFAHPVGTYPPTIKIHGNQTAQLPLSYRRYLINYFRTALKMVGTPLLLEFADSENPFKGKPNKLNEQQIKKKRRMLRHVKKKQ